jgi:hypothetical protein
MPPTPSGASPLRPCIRLGDNSQPLADVDEGLAASVRAAENKRAFGSGNDELSKGPPHRGIGPGKALRNEVGPPIEGLAADRTKCFLRGIEIQRDRADRATLVRASVSP